MSVRPPSAVQPSGQTPLDDSGMAEDESGVRLPGGVGGPNKDPPVASISRLRPRAAV